MGAAEALLPGALAQSLPPQPAMADVEGALKCLQAFVVDQWKSGGAAELRLFCESGRLKANVSADFGPNCPSWIASSTFMGGNACGSPSRQRRRQRRAAARAVAGNAVAERDAAAVKVEVKKSAAEKYAAEKVFAERLVAEEAASETTAAVKAASEKSAAVSVATGKAAAENATAVVKMAAAEEVAPKSVYVGDKAAAMKAATEKVASEKEDIEEKATVMKSDSVASTSCIGKQLPEWVVCWNCGGKMSNGHQCDAQVDTSTSEAVKPDKVVEEQPPPLPLCHYCCHRGSGSDPVHYFMQCVCDDWPCSCWCYCTSDQLEHKKLVFPGGFGLPGYAVKTVNAEDRPKARALAEARTGKARPCDNPSCMEDFKKDNARALGQL